MATEAIPEFHNPWRDSLENCISGDNYLSAREYADLIAELDHLYIIRAQMQNLLWNDHPECCGCPVVGAEYMGQQEMVCCGNPEPALLSNAQIVGSLRAMFPEPAASEMAHSSQD